MNAKIASSAPGTSVLALPSSRPCRFDSSAPDCAVVVQATCASSSTSVFSLRRAPGSVARARHSKAAPTSSVSQSASQFTPRRSAAAGASRPSRAAASSRAASAAHGACCFFSSAPPDQPRRPRRRARARADGAPLRARRSDIAPVSAPLAAPAAIPAALPNAWPNADADRGPDDRARQRALLRALLPDCRRQMFFALMMPSINGFGDSLPGPH